MRPSTDFIVECQKIQNAIHKKDGQRIAMAKIAGITQGILTSSAVWKNITPENKEIIFETLSEILEREQQK